jgi:type II secretory pathway pseudopilin PulG
MMQPQGWRRLLPERSQFMLLVIVVIALVAGMSFVNLGIARNSALAQNQTAHALYDEAQQQNERLKHNLVAVQRGENIPSKAYDYFFMQPSGVTTILLQPVEAQEAAESAAARRTAPPFWGDWWQRLVNP